MDKGQLSSSVSEIASPSSKYLSEHKPVPCLDDLPNELLRLVITHLDPPSLLAFASLSTHLRSILLYGSHDLLEQACRTFIGWWWRPFGDAPHQAFRRILDMVRERACPFCRLIPPDADAGTGYRETASTREEGTNDAANLKSCSRKPVQIRGREVANNVHKIESHILLPHVRACRTCLRTHPSLTLISAHTALQRYAVDGLDVTTLDIVARSHAIRMKSVPNAHRHKRDHPGAPRRTKLYLLKDIVDYLDNNRQADGPTVCA
ncbi:hypothetical protein CF326_g2954 [Tilletia indica]|nr:hypothetical protein CF326_g2954 [Tilletia indica]